MGQPLWNGSCLQTNCKRRFGHTKFWKVWGSEYNNRNLDPLWFLDIFPSLLLVHLLTDFSNVCSSFSGSTSTVWCTESGTLEEGNCICFFYKTILDFMCRKQEGWSWKRSYFLDIWKNILHIVMLNLWLDTWYMLWMLNFLPYFDEQMLTSKDSNFIGYTFKKSDLLKSAGTAGTHFVSKIYVWILSTILCMFEIREYFKSVES